MSIWRNDILRNALRVLAFNYGHYVRLPIMAPEHHLGAGRKPVACAGVIRNEGGNLHRRCIFRWRVNRP